MSEVDVSSLALPILDADCQYPELPGRDNSPVAGATSASLSAQEFKTSVATNNTSSQGNIFQFIVDNDIAPNDNWTRFFSMRVLILGGTRFIGWHTASQLSRNGHDVTVFHRGSVPLRELSSVGEILGDRADLPRFRNTFRNLRPDAVIDCIGYTAADGMNLIETFRGWLDRPVFLSSCDVYRAHAVLLRATTEPLETTPLHEGSALRSNAFPYRNVPDGSDDWRHDYDKIPIERLLLAEPAFQTTVLRLSAIYGPRDYQRRVWEYLRKMDTGREFIVVSESMSNWRWSRAYVENIASAVAHLLQSGGGGGGGGTVREAENFF
jgi:nucleoside-diphosphate-sugar epimerase